MSAWINCHARMPETIDDGFERVSEIVLIYVGATPYTARLVVGDEDIGTETHWRLVGRDGYREDFSPHDQWCEVPK